MSRLEDALLNTGIPPAAIEQDLPRAPHGLYATWRELLRIRRCAMADQNYRFVPDVHPSSTAEPG